MGTNLSVWVLIYKLCVNFASWLNTKYRYLSCCPWSRLCLSSTSKIAFIQLNFTTKLLAPVLLLKDYLLLVLVGYFCLIYNTLTYVPDI